MITGRYNHSVTGVSSIASFNFSAGAAIAEANSRMNDEVVGALTRYYGMPIEDIYWMISEGKIKIASQMGDYERIIDVERSEVICRLRRPYMSSKSSMDWHGFPTFRSVIEFKFQAFDNKTNRDSINPQQKTKGKRK